MRVTLDITIKVKDESKWDGDAAREAILKWAGYSPDLDEQARAEALSKAERLFLLRRDESNTAGDLVAPCGSVADGEPYLSTAGLRYARAALNGARGGIDAPDEIFVPALSRIDQVLKKHEQESETGSLVLADINRVEEVLSGLIQNEHPQKRFAVKITEEGGALKASGYAIIWGGADLYGESFTPTTDLGESLLGIMPPVLYEHALHPKIGYTVLGRTKRMTKDEIGLLVEAELDRHNEYIEMVRQLAEQGVLGWSTGAPGHLVQKEGKTITRWPIVEISLTPTPAEPRTIGVEVYEAIRALDNRETVHVKSVELDGETVGEQERSGKKEEERREEKEMSYVVSETTKTVDDFVKAVGLRQADALKAMGATDGPSGGYLVPDVMVDELLEVARQESIFLQRAYVIRASGVIRQPVIDVSLGGPETFAWFGGVKLSWQAEGGPIAETEPRLKQYTLRSLALAGITRVSNRLLAQSRVDSSLRTLLASAIGRYLDFYCMRGTGTGQPLGILNAPALVSVSRGTASTITPADVAKMYARFSGNLSSAVWLTHPTALPQLIAFSTGNAPVWMPDMREGVAGTLFGLPVIVTEIAQPIGSTGDIVLADLQMYAVQLSRDIEITTSEHAYFAEDQTAYKVLTYADGQPRVADKAVYVGTTIEASPFVALS